MYKQSVFFTLLPDAEEVQSWVDEHIDGIWWSFTFADWQKGTIEYRFYTDDKLSEDTQRSLLKVASFTSHAFNVEE